MVPSEVVTPVLLYSLAIWLTDRRYSAHAQPYAHTQAETLGDWLWLSARANQRAL